MVCSKSYRRRYASPALAAASYPFVDLPSGDTLRCKLFPGDKFYKISLYFEGRIKYNEVNEKSEFVERFPELSLFFKAYSLLDSEMICIFPYFCPYAESAREIREIFS